MLGRAKTYFWLMVVVAAAALGLLGQSVSAAQGADQSAPLATIVLVADHPDASIVTLLRGELSALGLDVLSVNPGEQAISPRELAAVARAHVAIAAFQVFADRGQVEVWLTDRATGNVLLREVLVTQKQGVSETDESTVVARAVELLRASLLELDVGGRRRAAKAAASAAPPKQPEAPPPVPAVERSRPGPRIETLAGFSELAASTRIGAIPGIGLGLRVRPVPAFGFVARAYLPLGTSEYERVEGRAQVKPRWGALGLGLYPGVAAAHLSAAFESGVGGLFVSSEGIAAPGYGADSKFTVDPVIFVNVGVRYDIWTHVGVSLGCLGGLGLRPTKIVFQDDTVAHYGRWLVLPLAAVEAAWN